MHEPFFTKLQFCHHRNLSLWVLNYGTPFLLFYMCKNQKSQKISSCLHDKFRFSIAAQRNNFFSTYFPYAIVFSGIHVMFKTFFVIQSQSLSLFRYSSINKSYKEKQSESRLPIFLRIEILSEQQTHFLIITSIRKRLFRCLYIMMK